ncbi:craniofacial development protein 2-like [Cydia strobilella]|uniref:craniofacial development protein 2-like n=1 Tax=Cydia strobilella TaxID=1100964 RepID=UPI003004497D
MRIATWNVGSMTGRGAELSEVLLRRKVAVCCIQETKWRGSKARNIGNGYKFIYHGTTAKQNGVGIAINSDLQERIVEVTRVSDRIIAVKLALDNQPCMNVVSAYAPQMGCSTAEKQSFWDNLSDLMQSYPLDETNYVAGDLNGHVGSTSPCHQRVHGGQGYGNQNAQGVDILNFAVTHDMAIINTFFIKPDEHKITYKSGGSSTQIDYILADRSKVCTFKDCKIIPGEPLATQHRLLVADFLMSKPIKVHKEKIPKIRWYKLAHLEGDRLIKKIQQHLDENPQTDNSTADTLWTGFKDHCIQNAAELLGISKGPPANNKKAKWWKSEVEETVKTKKTLFKTWQQSGRDEDRENYRTAKREAKREVAHARAQCDDDFYSRLEKAKDDRELFKIARQRHTNSMDVRSTKYINNFQRPTVDL